MNKFEYLASLTRAGKLAFRTLVTNLPSLPVPEDTEPTSGKLHVRQQVVGFGSVTLESEQSGVLRIHPCIAMRVMELSMPTHVADHVSVDQITINGKYTLVNCGPAPGTLFAEGRSVQGLHFETIQPGCMFEVAITNQSSERLTVALGGVIRVAEWDIAESRDILFGIKTVLQ